MTILTLGVLFALLPFLAFMLLEDTMREKDLITILFQPNPYATMAFNTEMMVNPRSMGRIIFSWPLHCGIMLAGSTVLLLLSVSRVRKVALRQAAGQFGDSFSRRRAAECTDRRNFTAVSKRIKGPPVLWKELMFPIFGQRKLITFITLGIGMLLLFATYFFCARENVLGEDGTHIVYVLIFMVLGMLFTIILPATSITSEKESRSWPLLLATTLTDWQILFGKFIGSIRRCLPIWAFLFGHIIVFSACSLIHPIAILQMAILVAWLIVFFSCTGLYFSSRFKHTTTAVVMNFTLAAVIWALIPLLMVLIMEIARTGDDLVEGYLNIIPFVQAVVVMEATAGSWNSLNVYHWPEMMRLGALGSTLFMLTLMLGYMVVGFLFAWRAKCRFRRNIF
jgi:ABC-type transport system involved in multi-copper enzyme maturation permease subunit